MNSPTPDTPLEEECANCKHYPAYHDGDGGRPCRAWDPDVDDSKCACPGWTAPKPTYIPQSENA